MPISLRVADVDDLRWVEAAVRSCPVATAEFGGFYAEVTQRLPGMEQDGRELLVVLRDASRVGFLDTDPDPTDGDGRTLGLAWFVVPEERGRHVTADALALLRERRPGWRLQAAIDADNAPSLGAARRAGFLDTGSNRWGERVHVLA